MGADDFRMLAGFLRDVVESRRDEEDSLEETMSPEVMDVFLGNFWKKRDKKITPFDKKDQRAYSLKTVKPRKKWTSAGGVVFNSMKEMNKVWIIKPSNNFGPWSFPKGKIDEGESMKETAVREVEEEAGIAAKILPGGYLGKGVGRYSVTHYFAMVRTGGSPGKHDSEVEKVVLASFTEAFKKFNRAGNKRDIRILRKAWEYTNKLRKGKVKGMEKHEKPPWVK